MHVFISGGCKNGKSYYAQRIAKRLADGGALYYVATMQPCDSEDDARIARHICEREGWGFQTIEQPRDIAGALDGASAEGTFLLDSVTALLANEMFTHGGTNASVGEKVARDLAALLSRAKNVVLVSDFIYADAGLYDEFTELYRRALAHVDASLAAQCDSVIEVCSGCAYYHKGGELVL